MSTSTTETAAAAPSSSLCDRLKIHDEATSVLKGRLPEIEHHRAELADRPGEGQAGSGQHRRGQARQDDPPQHPSRGGRRGRPPPPRSRDPARPARVGPTAPKREG